ncbi:unnamed protein product [Closterium sp. NIES-64]|nr:unnamed protein product [Closterium sp. NIES-64]
MFETHPSLFFPLAHAHSPLSDHPPPYDRPLSCLLFSFPATHLTRKLGGQNISGPIPTDAFRNLTALQELDLSSNPLNGTMEFLAYLPALQYLSLAFNYLTTGELPDSLSALTRLAHLYVQASAACWGHLCFPLCCALPSLCLLHRTKDVTAPDGLTPARSSPFPADWMALTSLKSLMASGNGFSGSLPATISALTTLSEFPVAAVSVLSHNDLEGPFSAPLASLPLMEEIRQVMAVRILHHELWVGRIGCTTQHPQIPAISNSLPHVHLPPTRLYPGFFFRLPSPLPLSSPPLLSPLSLPPFSPPLLSPPSLPPFSPSLLSPPSHPPLLSPLLSPPSLPPFSPPLLSPLLSPPSLPPLLSPPSLPPSLPPFSPPPSLPPSLPTFSPPLLSPLLSPPFSPPLLSPLLSPPFSPPLLSPPPQSPKAGM